MRRHLPNLLTIVRLLLAPLGAGALYLSYAWSLPGATPAGLTDPEAVLRAMAGAGFAAFFIAAATDWLDGWLARRWEVQSAFGALLDPIADKLLVGLYLLAIAMIIPFSEFVAVPVFFIIARDAVITGLRLTRGAATSPALAVTVMAKVKTALEMIVIGGALIVAALDGTGWPAVLEIWILTLWLTAALSLRTGWDYWRAHAEAARDDDDA